MKSFIVLTFAFLFFVFYQLSGGADFEPRKVAMAEPEPAPPPAPYRAPAPTLKAATPAAVAARVFQPAVTPARMEPTERPAAAASVARTVNRTEGSVQSASSARAAEPDAETLARVRTSLSQGLSLFSETGSAGAPAQELTLVSLGDGSARLVSRPAATDAPAEPAAAPAPAEPAPDIREVIATRVNMRDGPGTIYPVIAQVPIGRQVEVLSDSGTGWLRLRTLPDRQLGWIAASLVSKPRQN